MVFVSDLYTTFANIADNMDAIPRDRVVDGVDQTALLLKGDTHGRRDYLHLYEVDSLKATVKQNLKVHWPPARGMPYGDVENLRPETKEMVELWAKTYGDAKHVVSSIEAIGN